MDYPIRLARDSIIQLEVQKVSTGAFCKCHKLMLNSSTCSECSTTVCDFISGEYPKCQVETKSIEESFNYTVLNGLIINSSKTELNGEKAMKRKGTLYDGIPLILIESFAEDIDEDLVLKEGIFLEISCTKRVSESGPAFVLGLKKIEGEIIEKNKIIVTEENHDGDNAEIETVKEE